MSVLFKSYLTELKQYAYLQKQLHDVMETICTITPLNVEKSYGIEFPPIQPSILKQIKAWPLDVYPYCPPPTNWVQPRTGWIMFDDVVWEYGFHGAGLSFFNSLTRHDVSIEYTRTGEFGITDWTLGAYFYNLTLPLQGKYLDFFTKAITDGYLIEKPPLLGQDIDEQTYVFSSKIYDVEI